jgi:hypothetical protein
MEASEAVGRARPQVEQRRFPKPEGDAPNILVIWGDDIGITT